MNEIVARMLAQEEDGIPGYMAHPEGPGQRPGILMVHHAHGVTADYKIDAYRLAWPRLQRAGAGPLQHVRHRGHHPHRHGRGSAGQARRRRVPGQDGRGLAATSIDRMRTDPARTGCIGHCMGGRLLIPFAADHPSAEGDRALLPLGPRRARDLTGPRHAFHLAKTLQCASLVFAAGQDYIATPAIQGPLWQSFIANGKLVEWHFFSDANHGFPPPGQRGLPALLRGSQLAPDHELPAAHRLITTRRSTMSEPKQKFSASLAKDAVYQTGPPQLHGVPGPRHRGRHPRQDARPHRPREAGRRYPRPAHHRSPQARVRLPDVLRAQGHDQFVYEGVGERTFGPRLRAPARRHRPQRARVHRRPRDSRDLLPRGARDGGGGEDARGRGRRWLFSRSSLSP